MCSISILGKERSFSASMLVIARITFAEQAVDYGTGFLSLAAIQATRHCYGLVGFEGLLTNSIQSFAA